MKLLYWFLFVAMFPVCFAATPPAKTPAKKAVTTKAATKGAATKAPVRKGVAAKGATARKGKSSARPVVTSSAWRSRQLQPTAERYKEIQEALSSKGYLKSEPNGVWDAQSSDAMRQFQTENKLSPTGKLSAASLISLGLGPKNDSGPITPPASPPPAAPPLASPRP